MTAPVLEFADIGQLGHGSLESWLASKTWGNADHVTKGVVDPRTPTPIVERRLKNAFVGAAASGALLLGGFLATSPNTETTITSAIRQAADRPAPAQGLRARREADASGAHPAAIQLVDELKDWLSLADDDVARLAGVSRRSITNWRSGRNSYSASTRQLSQVHALVRGLVASLGSASAAQLWLSGASSDGLNRLDRIAAGQDGVRAIVSEAAAMLFAAPVALDLSSGLSAQDEALAVFGAKTGRARQPGPPKRVRRPPPGNPRGDL